MALYCKRDFSLQHEPAVSAWVVMQTFAEDLAGEYVRHFTQQELVIGAEAEARLAKTLIKRATLADVLAVAQEMRSRCSCIVKVEHHANAVTEEQLLQVPPPCPSALEPNVVDTSQPRGERLRPTALLLQCYACKHPSCQRNGTKY